MSSFLILLTLYKGKKPINQPYYVLIGQPFQLTFQKRKREKGEKSPSLTQYSWFLFECLLKSIDYSEDIGLPLL